MIFGLGLEKAGSHPDVIQRAVELGVRFFDTAPTYGNGVCEVNLGNAIKAAAADKTNLIVSTKTHLRSPNEALSLLHQSLSRLQRSYVDLWSLHDLATPYDIQVYPALVQAKKEGMTKAIGITCMRDPLMLLPILRDYHFDYVMLTLNVADKQHSSFITEVLPYVGSDTKIIAMQVFMRGKSRYQMIPYLNSKSTQNDPYPCPVCKSVSMKRVATLAVPVIVKWQCPQCGKVETASALEAFQVYQDCMNYVASYNPEVMLIGCHDVYQLEEDWVMFNNRSILSDEKLAELELQAAPFAQELNYFKRPRAATNADMGNQPTI